MLPALFPQRAGPDLARPPSPQTRCEVGVIRYHQSWQFQAPITAAPGLQPTEYTDILNCCAQGTPGCTRVSAPPASRLSSTDGHPNAPSRIAGEMANPSPIRGRGR